MRGRYLWGPTSDTYPTIHQPRKNRILSLAARLLSNPTMPRPKVHPSNRQRAAEACNFCRMSKKRCSATVPCTACVKRGIEDTCKLTRTPKGPGTLGVSEACFALSPPVSKPSKDRVVKPTTPHVAAARHKRNASNDWSSQLSTSLPSSGSTFSIPQDDGLKERRSSSFGTEFQPRMLLNSSGDRSMFSLTAIQMRAVY